MLWTDKAKKIIKKYWGYGELKEKQIEVINELLLGNDVIGLLPTGYGKSMCYLIPPLVTKKAIIIISPLISLMDDQKEKLIKMNIPVSALHGNNKKKDIELFEIIDGNIKIIYMSPEYLIKGEGFELVNSLVEQKALGFLAVDEAHCISVWGHDFRPEYLKIKEFREKFPEIPMLAVTATATNMVVNEMAKHLGFKNPTIVRANFDRPNLYIKCIAVKSVDVELLDQYYEKYKNDKIIIYVNSRNDTVELAELINKRYKEGRIAEAYHAGMSKGLREKVQTKFSENEIKIIVSTIAFGMGVDQIVRCVIVFGAPSSIEEYWQQIGRAGRDNKDAETILFFQYKSLAIAKSQLKTIKNINLKKNRLRNLGAIGKYFYLNSCRRKFVLEHFDQICNFYCCDNCDNCCEKELTDITDIIWSYANGGDATELKYPKKELENINQSLVAQKLIKKTKFKIYLGEEFQNWKKYIDIKKIKKEELPDKLRVRVPIQVWFGDEEKNESEIDKCEKLYKDLIV